MVGGAQTCQMYRTWFEVRETLRINKAMEGGKEEYARTEIEQRKQTALA